MKPIFWPYKMSSQSCKLLARELSALRVYANGRYKYKPHHLLINWGNSVDGVPTLSYADSFIQNGLLNPPDAVSKASNKLSTLRSLHDAGVGIPPFTISKGAAILWGFHDPVYCRTTLTGKGGDGIIVASNEDELVDAPLYTLGVGVKREFRVHVFQDRIIDFTEKKKRRGAEHNEQIRNFKGGWVFCRQGVELPTIIEEQAILAVQALGLDFGAVDICLTTDNESIVFEVNTAPGICNTTLTAYTTAIKNLLDI